MHVHYLTPLKGVYRQLHIHSRSLNQAPFYSLDFYSSTIVESFSPSSPLIHSVHLCVIFTLFYTRKKHEMYHLHRYYRFVSQADNETLHKRCLVYNNLLWMWTALFCQKEFMLWNCSVHTWEAGRELLFH